MINSYVSSDKYKAVNKWMEGTIRGFKDEHGIVGRPPMHFDLQVIHVTVDKDDQGYYGHSKDVELWSSQWEREVEPLGLQAGDNIRVGFNEAHIPVVVEKLS